MILKRYLPLHINTIMFDNTLILDFETSGLNPFHDDIIEIAAKKLRSADSFSTLVKSKKTLDKKIVEITKITEKKGSKT